MANLHQLWLAGYIDSICFLHLVADDDDVDMTLVRRYLPEHIIALARSIVDFAYVASLFGLSR